jgi:hypothetical protein
VAELEKNMDTQYEARDPATGEWRDLVRTVSPDACEYCQAGIYTGHDHPECETLVPASATRTY